MGMGRHTTAMGMSGSTGSTLGPYAALGHHFTVSVDDPALATEIQRVLASLATAAGPEPSRYVVTGVPGAHGLAVDGQDMGAGPSRAHVLATLLWDMNRRAVEATTDHLILHAGAVVLDDRAIILPAAMESGKTTLVTALVRAGCEYLSDELAALPDPGAQVVAYPKAISIDPGSWPLFPELAPTPTQQAASPNQWLVTAETIRRGATRHIPADLRAVILPQYRGGATTELRRLRAVDALKALAECTFGFHEAPADILPRLARIVESVPAWSLTVGDGVDDAIEAVWSTIR